MKRLVCILSLLCVCVCAFAQSDRHEVRQGNRRFGRGDFKNSEISYRKGLVKDSTSFAGNYNLASSLYRQQNYSGAVSSLSRIKDAAPGSRYAADYYFNLGDAALQSKDYKAAVDAFKKSLLIRPDDMDAKQNYVYAKKMLENQQQNQQQNQDQNQNQDRNQDQQDKQNPDNKNDKKDNQDNKDNQNQQDQQDNGQDEQNQQDSGNQENNPQGNDDPQSAISPRQGQQILDAVKAKEKETLDKVGKEKAALLKSRQKEKNW